MTEHCLMAFFDVNNIKCDQGAVETVKLISVFHK